MRALGKVNASMGLMMEQTVPLGVCCVVMCCVVLCRVALCCVVLHCIVLCCIIEHRIILFCAFISSYYDSLEGILHGWA